MSCLSPNVLCEDKMACGAVVISAGSVCMGSDGLYLSDHGVSYPVYIRELHGSIYGSRITVGYFGDAPEAFAGFFKIKIGRYLLVYFF